MKYRARIRFPRDESKVYYQRQLQEFADNIVKQVTCEVASVEFAKQDTRGALSISLFDSKGCVPMQRHFLSTKEMFSFIEGYNKATSSQGWL